MAYDDLETRKRLTFKQAEGIDPLPTQMKRNEVTSVLRARLWELLFISISPEKRSNVAYVMTNVDPVWAYVLQDEFVGRRGGAAHQFNALLPNAVKDLYPIFEKGSYAEIFDFIQFIVRGPIPSDFVDALCELLQRERAAFRIIDNDTLMPVASEEETLAVTRAFEDTDRLPFQGTRTHLRQSEEALGKGKYADSVRESIHAVESVARVLEPSAKLSKALAILEKAVHLHPSMKNGFNALYGWTSDDDGIRHALLDDGDAKVDEADALFMIGACASFVSYLIAKKASAGIDAKS